MYLIFMKVYTYICILNTFVYVSNVQYILISI